MENITIMPFGHMISNFTPSFEVVLGNFANNYCIYVYLFIDELIYGSSDISNFVVDHCSSWVIIRNLW